MLQSELSSILFQPHNEAIRKLSESNSDAEFMKQFRQELSRFVAYEARNILPVPTSELIQRAGVHGFLPPPERRMAVIDLLQEREPNVTRESHEPDESGKPERPVDLATFHLITEVGGLNVADTSQTEAVGRLLLWAGRIVSTENVLLTTPSDSNIRVKKHAAVFHLIQRGVTGDFKYESFRLTDKASVDAAVRTYLKSFDFIFGRNPNYSPSTDHIAHIVLGEQIEQKINKDMGPGKISLPLVVFPRTSQTRQERGSEVVSYTPPIGPNSRPMIVMTSDKQSVFGRYGSNAVLERIK